MSDKKDITNPTYYPSPERPYFVYCPNGDGFCYFATKEDRDAYSETVIDQYLDECWDSEVENVVAGELTSRATKTNISRPLGTIDEEGFDEDGEWWGYQLDYKCDYKLEPLDYVSKPEKTE